jgi:hypothetical protein
MIRFTYNSQELKDEHSLQQYQIQHLSDVSFDVISQDTSEIGLVQVSEMQAKIDSYIDYLS